MRKHLLAALAASVSGLALGAPVAQAATNQMQTTSTVQEIVVTAEKRNEALSQVPMGVSALPGVQLEKLHQVGFIDYASSVPGLSLVTDGPGITRLTLRGLNSGGVGSTVAIYVDESPFGSSSALLNGSILTGDFDTFDLGRIEVLRGPQGTLYGAGSEGGLLKFVTVPPQLGTFSAMLQLDGETVNHGDQGWSAHGYFNAPIGSEIAVRVDGFYQDLPGWIDDPTLGEHDVNHGRKDGGRGSILFKPTEKLSVRLTAFGQETLNHGTPYVDYNPATLQPIQDLAQHRLINDRLDFQYQNYNGTINYDAGPVTIISSTSYSIFDTYDFGDVSPLYGPLFTAAFGQTLGASLEDDTHLKKFSQEIRLASPSAQRLEWQVGAFYTRETAALDENLSAFDPATRTTPAGLLGLEVPILNSIYTEWAGFGNLTLHLSRAFDIQAGGRYSSNSQTATETVTGPLVGPGFTFSTPSSGDSFTWSVAPRWHLNPDTMIYARIATGFRPGGPNDLPVAAPPSVPREYGPDRTVNYEIGARTALLDHRLSIDVDAFYIDWKDIQLFEQLSGFGIDGNGGTARSYGFEYNFQLVPVTGLTLSLDGAYTNAELTSDAAGVGGLTGNWLPWAPRWSESADGEYDFPLFSDFEGFFGGRVSFVGRRYSDFQVGIPQTSISGYTTIDLRAGLQDARWLFEVYVKNVGDSRGITDLAPAAAAITPAGDVDLAITQPRTLGIQISRKF